MKQEKKRRNPVAGVIAGVLLLAVAGLGMVPGAWRWAGPAIKASTSTDGRKHFGSKAQYS